MLYLKRKKESKEGRKEGRKGGKKEERKEVKMVRFLKTWEFTFKVQRVYAIICVMGQILSPKKIGQSPDPHAY